MKVTDVRNVDLTEETRRKIAQICDLDLKPIARKLAEPEPGVWLGGDRRQASKAALWDVEIYRMYLILLVLYPGRRIVPPTPADRAWHQHILDTLKYFEDCENIFGFYLHHFPYLGHRGADDNEHWLDLSQDSFELFRSHFGVIFEETIGRCSTTGACDSGGGCATFEGDADVERPTLETA